MPVIKQIDKSKIILKNGEELPYKMAMLIPPFEGTQVMQAGPKLVDDKGFVETDGPYKHITYKMFIAGQAVKVVPPFQANVTPFGMLKTGYPSDVTGKIN
ncbi:MAG: hypothetical protein AAF731_00040 [Bacteroidota bacterium]